MRSLRTCPVVEDLFRILIVALATTDKGYESLHSCELQNGELRNGSRTQLSWRNGKDSSERGVLDVVPTIVLRIKNATI
jgi:hypothetical protein